MLIGNLKLHQNHKNGFSIEVLNVSNNSPQIANAHDSKVLVSPSNKSTAKQQGASPQWEHSQATTCMCLLASNMEKK